MAKEATIPGIYRGFLYFLSKPRMRKSVTVPLRVLGHSFVGTLHEGMIFQDRFWAEKSVGDGSA